jgi:diguanylate cyclase (GGDEF)-like protein
MWSTLEIKHRWEGEIWNKNKAQESVPFWLNINAIMEDDFVYYYIGIYADRSGQVQANEKMNFLSSHDVLTHLINRESFVQRLHQVLYWAKINNNQAAVLSIDLNRFKTVNDTLGHNIGDMVLMEVAKNIRAVLKERDIVARPGGDEFLILLENIHSENEAASVASHIMQIIQQPIQVQGHVIHTSASVGISLFPSDGEDEAALIKAADSAMHQAKNSGKNNFEFFKNELSKQVMRRMKLENALHKALEKKELFLVFQPQHLFESGALLSAEVLLRWNSQEYGIVTPDEFIPIAEESGLIVQIGEWVFRNSCKAVRQFKAIYPELKYLAVNVSSEQFTSYDIVSNFSKIIEEEKIATSDIEIELTERSVMQQTGSNGSVLDTLRALGFKISVDDFGTGYSSMSYLKSLPIDAVKIDKSFVDGLPHHDGDVSIVKAILALIQSLGYHTVAEGVEYKEQLEMLNELGCEIAQGYYYSKPLNHNDFIDYIEKAMMRQ